MPAGALKKHKPKDGDYVKCITVHCTHGTHHVIVPGSVKRKPHMFAR